MDYITYLFASKSYSDLLDTILESCMRYVSETQASGNELNPITFSNDLTHFAGERVRAYIEFFTSGYLKELRDDYTLVVSVTPYSQESLFPNIGSKYMLHSALVNLQDEVVFSTVHQIQLVLDTTASHIHIGHKKWN